MPSAKCGWNSSPQQSGQQQLVVHGPTLFVYIGFDPNYRVGLIPAFANQQQQPFHALVDTGATLSCIDDAVAKQLGLTVVNRQQIAGVGGRHTVDVYLAQVHVSSLGFTHYGQFAGVHLAAGSQLHHALLGRSFLQDFTMTYDGRTGDVTIST
jgi:hypothetical protein